MGKCISNLIRTIAQITETPIWIISFNDRRAHTEPLFKRLDILNLPKLYVYSTQLFMFKYHHALVPEIFQNFFMQNSLVHSYDTRQANHMYSFGAKPSQIQRRLRIVGVNIYNHFCDKLNMDRLFVTYKYHLKKYLIDNEVSVLGIWKLWICFALFFTVCCYLWFSCQVLFSSSIN